MMNKKVILIALVLLLNACKKDASDQPVSRYISKIYDYQPAPGQFINEEGLGTKAGAQLLIGNKDNLVSLGAYGGYIIFGFDHSVVNSEGDDIAIYGNATDQWSEPGIVMVSKDTNGNGVPDDQWYELAGSEYDSTLKNYSITYYNPRATADVPWKDNQGHTGAVLTNASHVHSYYPAFAANQDSITFTGSLLRNTFGLAAGSSIYVNRGFAWGYSDNVAGNTFDITHAVDDNGRKVTLTAVDFIKVYTAQNNPGDALLGEISTEVGGAVDLHIK